jgi:hypothetical protein
MITQDMQAIHRAKDELDAIISKITLYQKPFISKILRQMASDENENANNSCYFILITTKILHLILLLF